MSENVSTTTLEAIVQLGIPQSLSLISIDDKNPWIPDSCATDHLTGPSKHFVSYIPCAGNEKIRIVDGSLVPIGEKGIFHFLTGSHSTMCYMCHEFQIIFCRLARLLVN